MQSALTVYRKANSFSMSTNKNTPAILQIIPELETGGAEQTTLDIGNALSANGWDSFVVSQGGRMVEALEAAGSNHIEMSAASKNPIKILINAFRLFSHIKEHKISLIHARSRAPAWSALIAARLAKIPFVTTYHGAYSQNSWIKGLYNSSMIRSDVIVANSQWTADLINSRKSGIEKKVRVIYRGTDFSAFGADAISAERKNLIFDNWKIDQNSKILLNLARLTGWKGQHTLIDALPAVLQEFPELVLVLAGDDQGRINYRQELESKISALGISNNVRIPGHCNDPAAACATASLVVVASIEPEAFGRAAVESQALETPVIVTNIGAVGETVLAPPQVTDDERTGWRIPPGDVMAMTDTILTVLRLDQKFSSAITRRARAHVEASFSLENMCMGTLDIYRALLK